MLSQDDKPKGTDQLMRFCVKLTLPTQVYQVCMDNIPRNVILCTLGTHSNSNASTDVVLSCIASPVSLTDKQPYHLQ